MTKKKPSPRSLYALMIVGLLLYTMGFWFVLVAPKRARSSELGGQVAALQTQVDAARIAAAPKPDDTAPIAVADIFRVAKAMPAVPDMGGIVLELARIAEETGISFQAITPATPVVAPAYTIVPIGLVFDGNFYELSDLLFRLRTLVGVRHGELQATGRLFSVQTVDFSESAAGFPEITANLTVHAYVYGAAPAAAGTAPVLPAGVEGTTSTSTETTSTTTEPAPAGEASASEAP